jgi:glucosamine--fructose-6-phosphate aminotransferase (isomerizing)
MHRRARRAEHDPAELAQIDRIILAGCGTAYHAAMVGEYLIETLARVPTEVEIASEFRYRNVPTNKNTLQFVMSQSGETIDTLAAMREGQRKGIRCLGIVNTVGSTIARESDGGVYIHAGPEIGVAATKTFTSQVTILTLLSLLLGRIHHLSSVDGLEMIDQLEACRTRSWPSSSRRTRSKPSPKSTATPRACSSWAARRTTPWLSKER